MSPKMQGQSFEEWQEGKHVASPISTRDTAMGRPSAVIGGARLSKRQEGVLAELKEDGDSVIIKKKDINMSDLAALSAHEGVEFALLTRKSERMAIRGTEGSVSLITEAKAKELAEEGWRWSGHTHVYGGLVPSDGDIKVRKAFGQDRSAIYTADGQHAVFGRIK